MRGKKVRNLSPLECTYLACDFEQQSLLVNQFVIEGRGELSLEALEEAAKVASKANPGMQIKLSGFWGFRHWQQSEITPSVQALNSKWNGENSQNADFDGKAIDCRNAAVVEIYLHNANGQCQIITRSHHAVCDGLSHLHFIQELFRALRNEILIGSKVQDSEWALVQKLQTTIPYKKSEVDAQKWLPVPIKSQKPELTGNFWHRFRFEGNTSKILAKIIKIFSEIAWQNNNEGHLVFRIPTTLRRFVHEEKDFQLNNLTSAIDIEIFPEDSVDNIFKKIISGMRNNNDIGLFPKNSAVSNWLPPSVFRANKKHIRASHQQGFYSISSIVSYVANIKLDAYSCDQFTATNVYAIPIPFESVSISCTLFVDENGLSCCISIPNALTTAEQCADMIEKIKVRLGEF